MNRAQTRSCVTAAGLMAVAAAILALQGDPGMDDRMPVSTDLPAAVGDYAGSDILFCRNEACPGSIAPVEDDGRAVCETCGSPLSSRSIAEERLLPADTTIAHKRYRNSDGESVSVFVVVSGRDQKSIHRPQQCLPAQGYTIEGRETMTLRTDDGAALQTVLLTLRLSGKAPDGGLRFSHYAYWFVGPGGRETPYHLERLFHMSAERLLHNRAGRWAYVAVATDKTDAADDSAARLRSFIAELLPLLQPQ